MTIGYGEIIPVTPIAQKSAILIGLLGQIYVVIVTDNLFVLFFNRILCLYVLSL